MEWIRVQDKSPVKTQIVLAWLIKAKKYVLVRFDIDKYGPIWSELEDIDIYDQREPDLISHWTPLPSPPKDE